MMRELLQRRTMVYAAVAAVLLVVYLLQGYTRPDRNALVLPKLPDPVNRIEIESEAGTVILTRDAGATAAATAAATGEEGSGQERWLVGPEQFPADAQVVARLLEPLEGAPRLGIVTERGNLQEYGLTGETRRRLTVSGGAGATSAANGETTLTVELGHTAPAGDTVYGRVNREGPILRFPRTLGNRLFAEVEDFRDMVVARVPAATVQGVKIRDLTADHPGEEVLVRPDGDGWILAGTDAAPQRVDDLLQELSSLTAMAYLPEDTPWEETIFEVEVQSHPSTSEMQVLLRIGPPDDSRRFPARISTSPYPFLLPEWRVRRLLLGRDALVDRLFDEA